MPGLGAIKEKVGNHWVITGQCCDCGKTIQRQTDDYVMAVAELSSMKNGLVRCGDCDYRNEVLPPRDYNAKRINRRTS